MGGLGMTRKSRVCWGMASYVTVESQRHTRRGIIPNLARSLTQVY